MIPAMYKHQINEQIERLTADVRMCLKYRRVEDAEYFIQKIESWKRLLDNAETARIGAKVFD